MKKAIRLAGFAIAAAIGLFVSGCESPAASGKTLESIAITKTPDKTEYLLGENLNTTGMVVTATYSDGSEATIPASDWSTSGYDKNAAGTQTVTVTHKDKTDTFEVTVNDPETMFPLSIEVTKLPTKTEYILGEDFNPAGMVVTVTYVNNLSIQVTTGYEVTGYDKDSTGEQTITVTYKDLEDTFTITVINSDEMVSKPAAHPDGSGPVAYRAEIELTTTTPDATIYYTTDGREPSETDYDSIYYESSKPFIYSVPMTIKAIAVKNGLANSAVLTVTYNEFLTFDVTFNSDGGGAVETQHITDNQFAAEPAPAPTKEGYTFKGWFIAGAAEPYNFLTYVRGPVSLTAKWEIISYSVTFNSHGGSPAPQDTQADHGGKIPEPAAITKDGYTFGGWYKSADFAETWNFAVDTVTSDVDLHVRWVAAVATSAEDTADFGASAPIDDIFNVEDADEWEAAVQAIANGGNNKNYVINIKEDFSAEGSAVNTFGSVSGVTIALRGEEAETEFSLNSTGSLLRIGSGQTLLLRNITLKGITTNSRPLIRVAASGTLEMKEGAKITGNILTGNIDWTELGAIGVMVDGTFTMDGGEISGNSSSDANAGGGVVVGEGGTFTMNDGEIFDNRFTINSSGGGGVMVSNSGTFIMKGGKIYGNFVAQNKHGGGVVVGGGTGTFIMDGGEIYDNELTITTSLGGGVYSFGTFIMNDGKIYSTTGKQDRGVYLADGTFTMNGGEIREHRTLDTNGPGVYVAKDAQFVMNNGEITHNSTHADGATQQQSNGGGVYVAGTFTLKGGKISANTGDYGGGVCVGATPQYHGTFIMQGGEISGNYYNSKGGGVYITGQTSSPSNSAAFIMYDGTISGSNTTSSSCSGGGIYMDRNATFRIVNGTIYGADAESPLKNNVTDQFNGAALFNDNKVGGSTSTGTAEYGTFTGDTWNKTGELTDFYIQNTIQVINGVLQNTP